MDPIVDLNADARVARLLQDGLDALNAQDPVELHPSPLLALLRHGCSEARQAKKIGRPVQEAIRLKEQYVLGPGEVEALIYRYGECTKCSVRARSLIGRVVLTAERPPIAGRVARE